MISPKLQKASFYTILVLLFIFIPLTCYSMYLKYSDHPIEAPKENVNKELYFDGKLWFYNDLEEILGTYTCENLYCGYGVSSNNDSDYPILSYQKEGEGSVLPIIENQYVFITDTSDFDGQEYYLYDIQNDVIYNKNSPYLSIKNYNVGLQGNLFIVEVEEGKYNVLSLENLEFLFEKNYDFIGVIDDGLGETEKVSDYFVVKDEDTWKILDKNEATLINENESIVTYNGEYVITVLDENYHIVNYEGEKVLDDDFVSLSFIGKYLNVTNDQNEFYILDLVTLEPISSIHTLSKNDTVKTVLKEDNSMEIYINDELVERVVST